MEQNKRGFSETLTVIWVVHGGLGAVLSIGGAWAGNNGIVAALQIENPILPPIQLLVAGLL